MSLTRFSSRPFHRFHGLLAALLAAILLVNASFSGAAEPPPASWKDALTLYKAEDYLKARDAFQKIAADEGQISAALCHNLANCEYKLGEAADGDSPKQKKEAGLHYGPASIWYRRAVALDPFLPEAKQNLRWLESKLGLLKFRQSWLTDHAQLLPKWRWRTAAMVSIWGAAIGIVWLVWATPRRGRRWPLVTLLSISLWVLVSASVGLIGKANDPAPFAKRLIVVESPQVIARVAPAEASGSVITLPVGSELIPIRDEEGLWTYCDIPGSDPDKPLRGWVRTKSTERLWPWSPAIVE